VGAAYAARRAGVPILVAFLAAGMFLGSEGPGGIAFDDAELARTVGAIGLVAILYEGGLTTAWADVRRALVPTALLATAGVAVTAALTGLAAYALLDVTLLEALLLGAVVGSTDAAAVFATLRATTLRRRLGGVLEAESGLNDPMAVALTLGLIALIATPGYGGGDLGLLLVRQLGLGLALGVAIGAGAAWVLARLPEQIAPFAPVASMGVAALSFGATDALGGSGFLAVYLVALRIGNTPSPVRRQLVTFHEGLAYLSQIVLFGVLGLLVFPSELAPVALPALALAIVLVLVARPVAVWLCTIRQGFSPAERALLAWAGLRGAVPIVLGTFVLSEGLASSDVVFNAVFFVVIVSALLQGPTLERVASRLGVASEARAMYQPPLEIGAVAGAELLEFTAEHGDALVGAPVRELGLPRAALVATIVRDGEAIPPRGRTTLEADDRLYVLVRAESRRAVEALFARWRAGPLPGAAGDGP
jgi:potassium/hydrogen antiporter